MSDAYLNFANSTVGARVAAWLGLPKPVPLERFAPGQPVIDGEVLVAAGGEPQLLPTLLQALTAMQARTVAHASVPGWTAMANQAGVMSGPWAVDGQAGGPLKAVVFDATGLRNAAQGEALHACFHAAARSLQACGRVVVIGRPPEDCTDPAQAAVQRALEGFVRALAKELKRGITAQTVHVSQAPSSGSKAPCVSSCLPAAPTSRARSSAWAFLPAPQPRIGRNPWQDAGSW